MISTMGQPRTGGAMRGSVDPLASSIKLPDVPKLNYALLSILTGLCLAPLFLPFIYPQNYPRALAT